MSFLDLIALAPELLSKLGTDELSALRHDTALVERLLSSEQLRANMIANIDLLKVVLQPARPAEASAKNHSHQQAQNDAKKVPYLGTTRGRKAKYDINKFCTQSELSHLHELILSNAPQSKIAKLRQSLQAKAQSRALRPKESFETLAKKRDAVIVDKIGFSSGEIALLRTQDDPVLYLIAYQTHNEFDMKSRRIMSYQSEERARFDWNELLKKNSTNIFTTLEEYKEDAVKLYKNPDRSRFAALKFDKRIGFVIAFYLASQRYPEPKVEIAELVMEILGNEALHTKIESSDEPWVDAIVDKLALRRRDHSHITLKRSHVPKDKRIYVFSGEFYKRSAFLISAFEYAQHQFGLHTDIFNSGLNCALTLKTRAELLGKKLPVGGNHKPLSLTEINYVLRSALETGFDHYCYCLLNLATCLRNEEMNRLARFKMAAVVNERFLNYKTAVKIENEEHVFLVSKTRNKVDFYESMRNPPLLPVSQIILRFLECREPPAWFFKVNSLARKDAELAYQRSFRTTGATYLYACRFASRCVPMNATYTRYIMAHKSEEQLIKKYAKHVPEDMTGEQTEDYLEYKLLEIPTSSGETVKLKGYDCAWGVWLTRHLLETMESFSSTEELLAVCDWIAKDYERVTRRSSDETVARIESSQKRNMNTDGPQLAKKAGNTTVSRSR